MIDKQEKILNAALQLFVEYGFHGTPTSKIAQEAGVSNGTLFHYYKTKDDLVIALYIHIKEKLASCTYQVSNDASTIKSYFKQMYTCWLEWAISHPVEYRFTHQFMSSPYFMKISEEMIGKYTRPLTEQLQLAIDARVLKPLPLSLILTLLTSHIDGVFQYLEASNLSDLQQTEIIHTSFDLVWDMIT